MSGTVRAFPERVRRFVAKRLRVCRRFQRRFGLVHGARLFTRIYLREKFGGTTPYRVVLPGIAHPIYLRPRTSDLKAFTQIFLNRDLDFSLEQTPATIVDAGANIGLASVWFANRWPNARIIALEVDDSNYELMRQITAPYPNICCRNLALWTHPTRVTIINPDARKWSFRVAETREVDGIPAVGVAELAAELRHIDLLKIDIEGAEFELFTAECEWLDRVSVVAVELHDRFRPGCGEALAKAIAARRARLSKSAEYTLVDLSAGSAQPLVRTASG